MYSVDLGLSRFIYRNIVYGVFVYWFCLIIFMILLFIKNRQMQ